MKKFKNIMLTAVLALCAFSLFACGSTSELDKKATLDTSGNYETATASAFTEVKDELSLNTSGYKVSMSMNVAGEETLSATYIVKTTGNVITEMAMKMVMNFLGQPIVANIYLHSGEYYIAMKADGESVKCKIDDPASMGFDVSTMTEALNITELVATISNAITSNDNGLDFKTVVNGDETKLHIAKTLSVPSLSVGTDVYTNFDIYLVYKTNAVNGAKVLTGYSLNTTDSDDSRISVVFSEYNDEIEFPSFDSYIPYSQLG